jgi:hypothetical protein
MSNINYDQLVIKEPIGEVLVPPITIGNRQCPSMTMINDTLVPNVKYYFEGGWIYDVLDPNPPVYEHVHRFNEIVMLLGSDPKNPEELGAELYFYVDGQKFILNKTGAMFIPAGVKHGPLGYNWFKKDHMMAGVIVGAGSLMEGWGDSGVAVAKKGIPPRTSNKDYSVYCPKGPVYEAGHGLKNCTSPSMTLLSADQLPVAAAIPYVNLCWIHDIPDGEAKAREHQHNHNELLIHFGGDTKNPFDLGAELEFGLGGKKYKTNKTSSVYMPQDVKMDYMKWNKVTRPHIELSLIFDCGDGKVIYGKDAVKK